MIIATLSRVFLVGAGLVIIGLITRSLGPDGYGQYSSIFAYLYVVSALADFGLYTILTREISRTEETESVIVSKIFSLRLFLVLVLSLASIGLLFFTNYSPIVKVGIVIASVSNIFSSMAQVLTGLFQKHLNLFLVSIADIASRLMQLLLVLFLVFLRDQTGIIYFVWAVVISEIIHFFIIFYFSNRMTRIRLDIDFPYWSKIIKEATPIAVSLVSVLIYFKLDTVLLSLMKPSYDVGVYSLAYKVLETVIFLPAIYMGLILPILSKYSKTSLDNFRRVFNKSFDVIVIFGLPVAIYFFIMAHKIINIVGGSQFYQAGDVLKILTLAIFLIFFGNLGGNSLIALDLQKKAMWIYIAGAVINLSSNVILIPLFSFYAAAWTTVATELFITIAMFWLIKKDKKVKIDFGIFTRLIPAGVTMFLLVSFFRNNFIVASLFSLSYFVIIFITKTFSIKDLVLMVNQDELELLTKSK